MTLKEFKKKSRQEKSQGYRYNLIGTVFALIGLAVVVVTFLTDMGTDVFFNLYPLQIVIYFIGLCIAVVGAIFSIIGDAKIKKDYQAYLNS